MHWHSLIERPTHATVPHKTSWNLFLPMVTFDDDVQVHSGEPSSGAAPSSLKRITNVVNPVAVLSVAHTLA